ncbi:MAG: TMEM175 family protein [Janthinobacterium lividum]
MTDKTHDRFQLERLAFFSDAVFAIAITLLIIEVRLPSGLPDSEQAIAQALADLIPQYIGFFVSFFVIGRFWIGHHRVFGRLQRADDGLIWRNLLFLMTIAFMPFPTALVSHFVSTRVGVGVYAAWLTLAGIFNLVLERYAMRGPLAAPGGLDDLRRWARAGWAPVVVGVLAFGCAMITPHLALVPLLTSPVITRLFNRAPKAA